MTKKRILVADDDPAIVDALQFALEDEGYDVETTVDARRVAALTNTRPDLILLDIWMSGMDGRNVAKALKTQADTKTIPIVMISANRDVREMSLEAGADDFLAKPFDIDVLISKIEALIGPAHSAESSEAVHLA